MQWNIQKVEAPFDSDNFPKGLLFNLQDEIEYGTTCAQCERGVVDFPRETISTPNAVPLAMYKAEIYCADCCPHSYNEETGNRINTLTGDDES